MSATPDMQLGQMQDTLRGASYARAVPPANGPSSSGLLSDEIATTQPTCFGVRISRSSNHLIVAGGIVHNTWVNAARVRIVKDGIKVWLEGFATYPVGSYAGFLPDLTPAMIDYRNYGPSIVEAGIVSSRYEDPDPTVPANTVGTEYFLRPLGIVRLPITDAEKALAVNGWYLEDANTDARYVAVPPLTVA